MPSYTIMRGEESLRFEVEAAGPDRYRITTPDGASFEVDAFAPSPGRLHLLVEGRSIDADVRPAEEGFAVQIGSEPHDVLVLNERQLRMRAAGVGAQRALGPKLKSPMAGKVVKIDVVPGQQVEAGDVVVVVEAMKMENDLKAHLTGTVSLIAVAEGDAVEVGDVLLEIEADEQG